MSRNRPEPGTEYASDPTAEYAAHRAGEAVRSLARYLGTTETRALELLDDRGAYATEVRDRRDVLAASRGDAYAARRCLERRWRP